MSHSRKDFARLMVKRADAALYPTVPKPPVRPAAPAAPAKTPALPVPVASNTPYDYGEIKAYNPSTTQRAKDWYHQKTQPGMLGPNPSVFNRVKSFVSNPGLQMMAGGVGRIPAALATTAAITQGAVRGIMAPVQQPAPAPTPAPAEEEGGIDWKAIAPWLLAALPLFFMKGGDDDEEAGGAMAAPRAPTPLEELAQRASPFGRLT